MDVGQSLIYKDRPSIEEFKKILLYGLRRKYTILFLTNCEVDYEGRSRSYLEPGDRIVIIKEDRSILIHRPKGYKPVNWQPSHTQVQLKDEGNRLKLICIRVKPREKITIGIYRVYIVLVAKLIDVGQFHMHLTEEELKLAVFNNLSQLVEEGMRGITMEKEVRSGKIDIFAKDADGNYVVIELKKGKATEKDVLQLNRYVAELRETNPNIRGILVSPQIASEAMEMIKNLRLEYKKVTFKQIEKLSFQ